MTKQEFFKLLRYPEKLPCDKRMHFILGVWLIAGLSVFTLNLYILGITLVTFAWGIEYFQKFTKSGQFDHMDAIAVVAGGLSVIVPIMIVIHRMV